MSTANNRTESGSVDLASLKRLAYFAAVVEGGSFTAAAERLGITKAVDLPWRYGVLGSKFLSKPFPK